MTETVTVTYVNVRERKQESRDHAVPDFEQATIEDVVDLFDGQVGTVLTVRGNGRILHRSMATIGDVL